MPTIETIFQLLGTAVVVSPLVLLTILGGAAQFNLRLSECSISRWTQASVLFSLIPALVILCMMLGTGIRSVPIELGNWVTIPEQHFHFHLD